MPPSSKRWQTFWSYPGECLSRSRYRNGAKAIRDLSEQVSDILADATRKLTDVDGIGETLAEKSQTLVETNQLPALEKLRALVPSSLRLVMQVPGVGSKKASTLWKELQVVDLATLKEACESGKVQELKGFGVKTEQAILKAIPMVEQASQRLRIDEADALVHRLKQHMLASPSIENLEFAGSYRRGRETVGDLDMLVISEQPTEVMDRLEAFPERATTIQRGDTKMSIRIQGAFQIDLRVVPRESWGAALQYFTGSKEHNVRVRSIAKQKNLKLNEYGLFDAENIERSVAGASEADVYHALGLPWIPPELREARLEFDGESPRPLPELITLNDLRGDLHMHTTASDGENSIEEMVSAAMARGHRIHRHHRSLEAVSIANGLDGTKLLQQWESIDRLNERLENFRVLKGIECDILENGDMDLPDEVLSQADWVMAAFTSVKNSRVSKLPNAFGCHSQTVCLRDFASHRKAHRSTRCLRSRSHRGDSSGCRIWNLPGIECQRPSIRFA